MNPIPPCQDLCRCHPQGFYPISAGVRSICRSLALLQQSFKVALLEHCEDVCVQGLQEPGELGWDEEHVDAK